ncbi:mannan-binding lectin [Sorangium sp. So ce448]|uniref:mannan-binding lectin n=1 Tax=Sorangium sp. So ce448 TaxID=3133314 RepID=UPI003F5DE253
MKTKHEAAVLAIAGSVLSLRTAVAFDVNAGPIWNNDDAQTKCPSQLRRVTWNGQWRTTEPGRMSVCGCNPPPRGDVTATGVATLDVPNRPMQVTCGRARAARLSLGAAAGGAGGAPRRSRSAPP